jgi:uncharacterized RDD family membrane protein YckC
MNKGEPPSRYPPADPRRRLLGRAIDFAVAFAPLLVVPRGHPWAGDILAAALLLCNDSLFGPGRSLGKRLAGLRVIALDGRPANVRESFLRNVLFLFGLLPELFGRGLAITAAAFACLAAVEACIALMPLTRDLGQRRLGDLLAGTQVIDASIAAGAGVDLPVKAAAVPAPLATGAAPLASRAARKHQETNACASR